MRKSERESVFRRTAITTGMSITGFESAVPYTEKERFALFQREGG